MPTLRGVGLVEAKSQIQIDRYSATSPDGVAVSFLDEANPYAGWKTTFSAANSWVRFNEVDFGQGGQKSIAVRAKSEAGGTLEVHLDKQDGPLVGRAKISKGSDWKTLSVKTNKLPAGVHDLVVTQTSGGPVEVDWVTFK